MASRLTPGSEDTHSGCARAVAPSAQPAGFIERGPMTISGRERAKAGTVDASPQLAKGAFGWRTLTLLGVSFTAAGYFAPWSLGLDRAGWAGMLLAFVLVGLFYFCLLQCLAEMSAAIPNSGGGQAFANEAFGANVGFAAGAAGIVQWICSAAALAVLFGAYVGSLVGLNEATIVIAAYGVFVAVLLAGAGEALVATLLFSLLALAGAILFVWLTGHAASPGALRLLDFQGIQPASVWLALPFGVTFFLGLEGVPLAAEEAIDPARDVPRGLLYALAIVTLLGGAVLLFGPAGVGTVALKGSNEPMLSGLKAPNVAAPHFAVIAVNIAAIAGLGTSLFGSLYACSRLVFAMARARQLPAALGRLNRWHAPGVGLIVPAAVSVALALCGALDQLIVVMVFCACVSYMMMFASFIRLRLRKEDLPRPYKVRFGIAVALLGMGLGIAIFSSCIFTEPQWSIIGAAMMLLLMMYRFVRVALERGIPSAP